MKIRPHSSANAEPMDTSRRRFVQGLATGGAMLGLGMLNSPLWALANGEQRQVLRGTEFDLTIGEIPINFTGQTGVATAVNGQVPAPVGLSSLLVTPLPCASPTSWISQPRSTGTALSCPTPWMVSPA